MAAITINDIKHNIEKELTSKGRPELALAFHTICSFLEGDFEVFSNTFNNQPDLPKKILNSLIGGINQAEQNLNTKNLMIAGGNITTHFGLDILNIITADTTITLNIAPSQST